MLVRHRAIMYSMYSLRELFCAGFVPVADQLRFISTCRSTLFLLFQPSTTQSRLYTLRGGVGVGWGGPGRNWKAGFSTTAPLTHPLIRLGNYAICLWEAKFLWSPSRNTRDRPYESSEHQQGQRSSKPSPVFLLLVIRTLITRTWSSPVWLMSHFLGYGLI